ncbi:MAG: hypothetical protein CV087_05725 [Candidatus Brocadia sp. WS118]|nr:MAG: hypothetical protein CV087_05725 [Candidatus Brocadia sp. WS118]
MNLQVWAYGAATFGMLISVWLFWKRHINQGTWVVIFSLMIFFGGALNIESLFQYSPIWQQIQGDADAISDRRKDIEEAAAIVNEDLKMAKLQLSQIVEKNELIDKRLEQYDSSLARMKKSEDFYRTISLAQNDDWSAYTELIKYTKSEDPNVKTISDNAIVKIRGQYINPFIEPKFMSLEKNDTIDFTKATYNDFVKVYPSSLHMTHPGLVTEMDKNKSATRHEKMSFYVEILNSSNSMNAKYYAGKYFVKESKDADLKWQPFNIDALLNWWERNRDKISD